MHDLRMARRMWTRFEPIHDVVYFTPEATAAYEAAGLRGYWRGYFAGRAAPFGAAGAAQVIATFFGFAPSMVTRAIPDVWTRATPAQALDARRDGAAAGLSRLLDGCDPATFDEAADLATEAVSLLDPAGRPLGASNMALTPPDGASALERLWQATTTMREHRGDGHVAALVASGFDGCESVVWRYANAHRKELQGYRGWTDTDWDAAVARLAERGWVDADGAHTANGEAAYAAVEHATDLAASRVWDRFGPDRTERLFELLTPLAIVTHTAIPVANPVGAPDPAKA